MLVSLTRRLVRRPPQPLVGRSYSAACHCDCWLEWENELSGNSTERASHWTLLVGTKRGPALTTSAALGTGTALAPLNKPAKPVIAGCSA